MAAHAATPRRHVYADISLLTYFTPMTKMPPTKDDIVNTLIITFVDTHTIEGAAAVCLPRHETLRAPR